MNSLGKKRMNGQNSHKYLPYILHGEWKRDIITNSKHPYIIRTIVFIYKLVGKVIPLSWNGIIQHCIDYKIVRYMVDEKSDEKAVVYPAIIKNGQVTDAKTDIVHFPGTFYLELENVITLYGIGCFIHYGEIVSPKESGYWVSLNHTANDHVIRYNRNKCYLIKQNLLSIPKGILLVSRWPENLCHVIIDVMLRLHIVDQDPKFDEWPILISELTIKNIRFMEVVQLFNIKHRPIITLRDKQNYMVSHAIIPSFLNKNITQKVWNGALSIAGFLSKKQVEYFRNICDCHPETKGNRKMFVFRPRHDRLTNEEEIMFFFQKNGFELIDTGNLTYEQQVECFKNVKWMVATHGAALTNIALCPSNATIVQITVPEIMHNVRFDNLAYNCGCKLFNIEAEVVEQPLSHLAPGLKMELPIERCTEIMKVFEQS